MKVVFFRDVEGKALVGEVKEVRNGYARNFLIPRGLAGPATKENLARARVLAEREAKRQAKLDAEAQAYVEKLVGRTFTIEARVGETGRLFGSVTNRDIARRIQEVAGVEVDPHIILLPEPIRELGTRTVTVKFTRNVSVDITVEVVPDEASKEIVERLRAQAEAEAEAERKRRAEAEYAARMAGQSEPAESGEEAGEGTAES